MLGAGVVNNAGAHHGDVARTLIRAEVFDAAGEARLLDVDELGFEYRSSRLKVVEVGAVTHTDAVVSRAWFAVQADVNARAEGLVEERMAQRLATQPVGQPSGGSRY